MEGRQGHFAFCQVLCWSATCWRVIKLLLTRSWRNANFSNCTFFVQAAVYFGLLKNVIVILKSASFKRRQAVPSNVGRIWDLVVRTRAWESWKLAFPSLALLKLILTPWKNSSASEPCKFQQSGPSQWDFCHLCVC